MTICEEGALLPPDTEDRVDAGGLSVDSGVQVALIALGPVYSHGLGSGLTAAGLRCTVLRTAAELAHLLVSGARVVAVLPQGRQRRAARAAGPAGPAGRGAHADAGVRPRLRRGAAGRGGATGAFVHDAELGHVVRTVQCAGLGLTLLPVAVARALNRPSVSGSPELGARDLEYLRTLANGATVAGLARRYGYSEREMYRLLSSVYRQLGAQNRTEALLLAQRFGLLGEET